MNQRIFLFLALVVGSFLLPAAWKKATDGFHLARFSLKIPFRPDWETSSPQAPLFALSDKNWTYLGRGAQAFVFENQDYVLKIFQKNRHVFFPNKEAFRRSCDLSGGVLAFQYLQKETALLFLHLNLTQGKLPSVTVNDWIGRSYRIGLDRCHFALQKKATPFKEAILQAAQDRRVGEYLDSFFALLQKRIEKRIRNEDRSLETNFGFIGQQAIEIDFGRYRMMDLNDLKRLQKEEWDHFTSSLRIFIQNVIPEEVQTFDKKWKPWTETVY